MVCVLTFSAVAIVKAEDGQGNAPIRPLKAQLNANKEVRKEINKEKKEEIKDLREVVKEERKDLRASSTEMFKKNKDDRKELAKKMQINMFEIRKNALIKELNFSLNNLTDIRGRINNKITKIEAGSTTATEARAALVIADDKLAKAKIAVDAFTAFSYSTSTPKTGSTTPEINLDKPRKIGDAAIKAVKDARDALRKVIDIVAKMEKKGPKNATTTPENN